MVDGLEYLTISDTVRKVCEHRNIDFDFLMQDINNLIAEYEEEERQDAKSFKEQKVVAAAELEHYRKGEQDVTKM